MKTITTNDTIIEEVIASPLFEIRVSGEVLVRRNYRHYNEKFALSEATIRKSKAGYCYIRYRNKNLAIHRLVYRKFKGYLNGLSINHIDGNKENNTPVNLETCTHSQNTKHMYRVLKRYGRHKLTLEEVTEMRELFIKGVSRKELATRYNISQSNVSLIITNKSWNRFGDVRDSTGARI